MEMKSLHVDQFYTKIRKQHPVIHCITNAVTVNDCANILLAIGASPVMAHHPLEVAEITEGTAALVCNMGAIADYEAMLAAGYRAKELEHPIVIDPVGVAGSSYRRTQCISLIHALHPTCIRGNYSEIRALIQNQKTAAGVDAAPEDSGEINWDAFISDLKAYASAEQMIVIASGETDIITNGVTTYLCHNGDSLMAKITGSGCMSSCLLGAFLGVVASHECSQATLLESAASCCVCMGFAGELAATRTHQCKGGTMTFRMKLIDAVSLMKTDELLTNLRVEIL